MLQQLFDSGPPGSPPSSHPGSPRKLRQLPDTGAPSNHLGSPRKLRQLPDTGAPGSPPGSPRQLQQLGSRAQSAQPAGNSAQPELLQYWPLNGSSQAQDVMEAHQAPVAGSQAVLAALQQGRAPEGQTWPSEHVMQEASLQLGDNTVTLEPDTMHAAGLQLANSLHDAAGMRAEHVPSLDAALSMSREGPDRVRAPHCLRTFG